MGKIEPCEDPNCSGLWHDEPDGGVVPCPVNNPRIIPPEEVERKRKEAEKARILREQDPYRVYG